MKDAEGGKTRILVTTITQTSALRMSHGSRWNKHDEGWTTVVAEEMSHSWILNIF